MSNLIVLIAAVAVPIAVAATLRRMWLAVFVSAVALSIVLHVASFLGAGYVDPFTFISIPVSLAIFAVWSLCVTWVVRRARGFYEDKPPAGE